MDGRSCECECECGCECECECEYEDALILGESVGEGELNTLIAATAHAAYAGCSPQNLSRTRARARECGGELLPLTLFTVHSISCVPAGGGRDRQNSRCPPPNAASNRS